MFSEIHDAEWSVALTTNVVDIFPSLSLSLNR